MAEIVGKYEDNTAREIEEMISTRAFSRQECETIIKKRKELDYKRRHNSFQCLKEYIEFELSLYRLIKVRRKTHGGAQKSLESRIRNRVKSSYERALMTFPKDTDLYYSFFKFCKESSLYSAAKAVTATMLKNNADNEEVWLVSARWHLHDRKNYQYAIQLLLQGIGKLGQSQALYKEVMQYEVAHVATTIKDDTSDAGNEGGTNVGNCNARLEVYLKQMRSTITDPQFYIEILSWLEEHIFTTPFQQKLIDFMFEEMSNQYVVWEYLAQRERRGFHINETIESVRLPISKRIINCIQKYEEGLQKVSSEQKSLLWNLYLDCLCEIKNEEFLVANTEKKKILIDAYTRASACDALLEKCYISWMELIDETEAYKVLLLGIEKFPLSVDLWKLRLRFEILQEDRTKILDIFDSAIDTLKEEALPLWLLMLQYHILTSNTNEMEIFYKSAIAQNPKISNEFKPKYINWVALNKTMAECRILYFNLVYEQPFCKGMYSVMFMLESSQLKPELQSWEKVHQLACEQFGKDDIEVWLNYVQFYFYYKKVKESKEKAVQIRELAKCALPEYMFLDFDEKFNLLLKDFQ